ncbi:putative lactoylglutathione lyase [Virgibacillus halotolerans]|uniref:integrase n=1 Tax=Virgibacillus halotolerans TaxID=1071053 RepID=UPI0019602C85|nr:integrase [Virgibacillus halotolerans]MBM7598991.1 putative lactoylglutathione lyase [Virgibacillus halotolerans]
MKESVNERSVLVLTVHSRNRVSEVVQRATKRGVQKLNDTMTNQWLEAFHFPEK